LQAGALVEAKKARGGRDAVWMRKQIAKNEVPRQPAENGALVIALDDGASVFDELAVLDARGAGSFASPAVETLVDVIDERGSDGDVVFAAVRKFTLRDANHLMDAAAGRIGFEVP
jgi:hypothetical protein